SAGAWPIARRSQSRGRRDADCRHPRARAGPPHEPGPRIARWQTLRIMTYRTLALRSLIFYARSHLAVLLGAAVGTAVLLGALVVGDSVRSSLRQFAFARLGKTQLALAANDRFFRSQLAEDLT